MKHSIKAIPILCAAVLAATGAMANNIPINGSIAFGAEGVVVNNPNLANATSFYVDATVGGVLTPNVAYVGEIPQGAYSSVPLLTAVTFNGFTFAPPVSSITPLWSFVSGGLTYSFDATTVTSFYNPSLEEWDIGGAGLALITGYTTTPGTWTVNLSQSDASFAFDATSGAHGVSTTPDGGSSVMLLGGACLGLGMFNRKARRA